ncbi:MAG: acyl-CoA dehydrogenase family protein [Solirubrobacterales bacterium]
MSSAELSIERENIIDTVGAFARAEVAPRVRDYDRAETVPRDLLERMAELGFYGGTIPEKYGGLGLDHETYAMAIEEMSTVCHMMGLFMSMASGLVGSGILHYGNEDQIERYLTPLAQGKAFGGAGVTEPHSGTDVGAMETTVERSNGAYILRGQKIFTSNLDIADFFVTFATLDPKNPRKGVCAFVVPKDAPGLTVRPFKDKLGFRPIATGELVFDECRVPAENRLGEEGEGLRVAMCAVENGRLSVAARSVGVARACLESSLAYARERVVFDQPIARLQLVQSKITDMIVGSETAHLLLRRAAEALDQGQPARKLVSMAKMHASDVAMRSATEAMQIHGAYSCLDDYPVSRYFRDAKFLQIVEGTNDLHRAMIAELEFGYRPER